MGTECTTDSRHPIFCPPPTFNQALSMKKIEHRSQGRDFFEMTRSDFFTETASTPNDWLRELRQELDLTMSQIGELVGVNRVQVWKWETGRVTPPKSALISALFLKIIRSIYWQRTRTCSKAMKNSFSFKKNSEKRNLPERKSRSIC